ncbi:hypothetical protein HY640_00590 [Candidatus Woesearchaeota archaeon]|nr:hypothetical protein [Candidatus Woesearchaeota archaeon]
MRPYKIVAMLYRDSLIIRRSKWRVFEILYFPLTSVLVWGFFSVYSKTFSVEAGLVLLAINIFWNFAYVGQSTANLQMMEDIWSGSLKAILLSGVTEVEYVVSRLVTAAVTSLAVLALMIGIALIFVPEFSDVLGSVVFLSLFTLVSSLALAIIITGMIVTLGKSYGFIAWTALQAFIFLSAPFFPKETFPWPVRVVSEFMPFTHIFEQARYVVVGSPVFFGKPALSSLAYFVVAWPLYIYLFRRARKSGMLAKLG